jgi:hypothetical protein
MSFFILFSLTTDSNFRLSINGIASEAFTGVIGLPSTKWSRCEKWYYNFKKYCIPSEYCIVNTL